MTRHFLRRDTSLLGFRSVRGCLPLTGCGAPGVLSKRSRVNIDELGNWACTCHDTLPATRSLCAHRPCSCQALAHASKLQDPPD